MNPFTPERILFRNTRIAFLGFPFLKIMHREYVLCKIFLRPFIGNIEFKKMTPRNLIYQLT